jgi:GNAT superfamily N-acetyltransferase
VARSGTKGSIGFGLRRVEHGADSILDDLSPVALALAIEANEYDLFTCAARCGRKRLVVEEDISWVIAKPSWPNFMFKPCFAVDQVVRRLAAIGTLIEKSEIPPVLKVGPGAAPADLRSYLPKCGFEDMGLSRPGLALDLHAAKLQRDLPAGLAIETVDDLPSLRDWIALATEGVWVLEEDYIDRLAVAPAITLYIGKVGDEPVGVSMLFLSGGVAGIYLVAVLPRFRGRGIGSALTLVPLNEARDAGYGVAVLQASDQGEMMYRNLGFREYCRFDYYRWQNSTYEDFLVAP